jgi:uncharacterized protein (DUF58 family)
MKREKIRLRPTGLWLLFGPILGCMWLAAVNYSNNLVYAVLYLVGSLTFVSIFHAWRNLAAVEIENVRVRPAFAGGEARVEIHLRNIGAVPAYGLFFARLDERRRPRTGWPLAAPGGRSVRVKRGDTRTIELRFPARQRGLHHLPALLVRTSYPFGLINASFRLRVDASHFIYPEAKGDAVFPALRPGGENGLAFSLEAGDDFSGVRPYAPGDSLRHVDWKAVARGRPLAVKQFTGEAGPELSLDTLPLETRLSQLAFWIVQAEQEEIPYSFHLGPTILPPSLGPEHARRALEALAVAR